MGGAETAAAWERSIKMAVLKGLKPEKVFAYFEKLCSVPHGSGNTKIISDLCVDFAKELGQDMRAVGQDMNVARDAGINVDRTRLISIVMSTVFAGFGMIIYLQNMGNFPTYTAHTNIGMFCIAALLVGGASVEKASIGNVFLGVLLFHTMFIVAPAAGTKITGDSMIGEYFRVFVSYAVITVALVMYEAKKRKENRTLGQQLAIEQKAEEEGRTA